MEILQSVITNSYPSLVSLIKFGLTQLIDLVLQLLSTYPINAILGVLVLAIIVHSIINKFFGDKKFRSEYKPL